MAEHMPTDAEVRECFVDGAAGEFIGEDFDRWLAAHDAELRAECSLLNHENRLADAAVKIDRLKAERDEAQRQVADLRAGIEVAVVTLNREVYRQPTPWIDRLANDLRTLLAGAGEQPGEVDGYCTCHDDQKGRTRDCGVKVHREAGRPAPAVPDVVRELDAVMHHHADRADAAEAEADRLAALLDVAQEDLAAAEAPAVPDSTDVRGELLHVLDSHGIDTYIDGTGAEVGVQNLITDILAVVGQGVTAEGIAKHIAHYVETTATALSPSSYRAGIASAVRLIRRWRPEYAAVRPTGQEGSR